MIKCFPLADKKTWLTNGFMLPRVYKRGRKKDDDNDEKALLLVPQTAILSGLPGNMLATFALSGDKARRVINHVSREKARGVESSYAKTRPTLRPWFVPSSVISHTSKIAEPLWEAKDLVRANNLLLGEKAIF